MNNARNCAGSLSKEVQQDIAEYNLYAMQLSSEKTA